MKEYERQVTDLNNQETFQSFMSYEEDQRLIQNTEKKIAYKDGLEQGIEQGIEQGSQNKQIEIAKNMLKENMDISIISRITGLDVDTLKKLSLEIK